MNSKFFALGTFQFVAALLVHCVTCPAQAEALKAKIPYSGFIAFSVRLDTLSASDLERHCIFVPTFIDEDGNSWNYRLDLQGIRKSKTVRYQVTKLDWKETFYPEYRTIVMEPTGTYEGADYYRPRTHFQYIEKQTEAGVEIWSYDNLELYKREVSSGQFKFGNRQAVVNCPFTREKYEKLVARGDESRKLSMEEITELLDLASGNATNPLALEVASEALR